MATITIVYNLDVLSKTTLRLTESVAVQWTVQRV